MSTLRRWGLLAMGVLTVAAMGMAPRPVQAQLFQEHYHAKKAGPHPWCDPGDCPGDKECPAELYGKLLQCVGPEPPSSPNADQYRCTHYLKEGTTTVMQYQDSGGLGGMAITAGESDPRSAGIPIGVGLRQNGRAYSGNGFLEAIAIDGRTGAVEAWIDFTISGYEFYGEIFDDGHGHSYGEGVYGIDGVAIDNWQIGSYGE